MNRHDLIFIVALSIFSTLVSFGLVFYSLGILTAAEAPEWNKVFGYVAAGYGLGNVYILSAAWRAGGAWPTWANKLIAFCFFGVFLLNLWRAGGGSGIDYLGALMVAAALWLNWYAVKRVSQRHGSPSRPRDDRKKPAAKGSRTSGR